MVSVSDTPPAVRVATAIAIAGLKELWAETSGDPRICIALLDGPIDQSHPTLSAANLTHVETLVPNVAGG